MSDDAPRRRPRTSDATYRARLRAELIARATSLSREGLSQNRIAETLGVNVSIVRGMVNRGEIPRTAHRRFGGPPAGPDEHRRASELLAAGMNLSEAARAIGRPRSALQRWIKIGRVQEPVSPSASYRIDWDREIKVALANDESKADLARRVGVSHAAVRSAVRARGAELRDGRRQSS